MLGLIFTLKKKKKGTVVQLMHRLQLPQLCWEQPGHLLCIYTKWQISSESCPLSLIIWLIVLLADSLSDLLP